MFWITVGQASRQTADAIGPSTIERSSFFAGDLAGGWMRRFYRVPGGGVRRRMTIGRSPGCAIVSTTW